MPFLFFLPQIEHLEIGWYDHAGHFIRRSLMTGQAASKATQLWQVEGVRDFTMITHMASHSHIDPYSNLMYSLLDKRPQVHRDFKVTML